MTDDKLARELFCLSHLLPCNLLHYEPALREAAERLHKYMDQAACDAEQIRRLMDALESAKIASNRLGD